MHKIRFKYQQYLVKQVSFLSFTWDTLNNIFNCIKLKASWEVWWLIKYMFFGLSKCVYTLNCKPRLTVAWLFVFYYLSMFLQLQSSKWAINMCVNISDQHTLPLIEGAKRLWVCDISCPKNCFDESGDLQWLV